MISFVKRIRSFFLHSRKASRYKGKALLGYFNNVELDAKAVGFLMNAIETHVENRDSVLDLGCGDFYLSEKYVDMGFVDVSGLDVSEDMLQRAREREPRLHLTHAKLPSIPLSDADFDCATSLFALQNVLPEEMNQLWSEVNRVLKPGGYFIAIIKHPMQQWLQKLQEDGDWADYFISRSVKLPIFGGEYTVSEPSHTFNDYLSITNHGFRVLEFQEAGEFPASAKIMGHNYPTFFLLVAQKDSDR